MRRSCTHQASHWIFTPTHSYLMTEQDKPTTDYEETDFFNPYFLYIKKDENMNGSIPCMLLCYECELGMVLKNNIFKFSLGHLCHFDLLCEKGLLYFSGISKNNI